MENWFCSNSIASCYIAAYFCAIHNDKAIRYRAKLCSYHPIIVWTATKRNGTHGIYNHRVGTSRFFVISKCNRKYMGGVMLRHRYHKWSEPIDYARISMITIKYIHGPLARYAKLRVRMRQEFRERFPRHRRWAIPTCITARASRTCRDACWDRQLAVSFEIGGGGKRSRHSRRMHNLQFYVSGKRPIEPGCDGNRKSPVFVYHIFWFKI